MTDNSDLIYQNLFLTNAISRNISIVISGAERIGSSWCALCLAHALNLEKKRVLLVATGALMNTTMVNNKSTIPSIAHAISMEVVE